MPATKDQMNHAKAKLDAKLREALKSGCRPSWDKIPKFFQKFDLRASLIHPMKIETGDIQHNDSENEIIRYNFPRNHFFWHLQLDPFVKFYCIFNALVRQNLLRWTGFDLLIISGVKF